MSKVYLDRLNDIQKEFVLNEENRNVLVSASAGTGKTTSMISKLVYLIVEKKVKLKELLVVTYTISAANEMKQKLFKLLSQAINNIDDLEERNRISDELDELNNADIGTIHSICKKLITKYFYELGIDPKFSILTDKEQKYLLAESIQKVFDGYIISKDEEFFNLFESYNSKRETEDLKAIVERIFTFLKSKEDAESWKKEVLSKAYDLNVEENSCARYLHSYYKDLFARFEPEFKLLFERADVLGLSRIDSFKEKVWGFFVQVKHSKNYLDMANFIANFDVPTKPNKADKISGEALFWEDMDIAFYKLKEIIEKAQEALVYGTEESFKTRLKFVFNNLSKIFEVVQKTNDVYSRLKQNKKCLDFNDLEFYTLELLKNEVVLEEIRKSYKHVFIDEYQDVNGVQEKIVTTLSNGKNLIMIGDVKQSIYEFRLSVPQNFIDKYNDKENNKIFDFNQNYRSEDNILQFVNSIFNVLISTKTIGLDYTNANLVCGKEITKDKCVSMDIVSLEKAEKGEKSTTNKEAQYEIESNLVVDKINDYITRINSQSKAKEYEFKDIAILTRKKGENIRYLYNKLQENNIPVSVELKSNLFDNPEVIFLISFLKILNNFEDDIALASVMKNPIFAFDENEFVEIKTFKDDRFWKNAREYDLGTLGLKLKNFWNTIEEYKIFLNNHKVAETLERFILDKGVLAFYKTLPDGLEKESNINEFLIFASNEAYAYSLNRFLDYISGVSDNNHVLRVKANENCVKITTMHSSKGLDYKAVIVYDFSSEFNLNNREKDLFICDKLGIGIRYFDLKNRLETKSLPMLACKTLSAKNQIDEEIRLFYVALTRAKKELYIVGAYNLDKILEKRNEPIYSCKSFLELLFYSVDDLDLYKFSNKIPEFYINEGNPGECKVRIIENKIQKIEREEEPIILTSGDNLVVKELKKYFDYAYPNKIISDVAVKNSVTSIMQEEVDYEKLVENIADLGEKSSVKLNNSALKIGTAYHLIMENLTYKEDLMDIISIMADLEQSGKLDKESLKFISAEKIFEAVKAINSLNPLNIRKEVQFILSIPYKEVVENSDIDRKVLIQGVVDLIIETSDGLMIIDFKTNRNCTEKYLINAYELQLNIYQKAIEKALKRKVEKKYIYSFELKKLIEIL